jgi:hypothetical protein
MRLLKQIFVALIFGCITLAGLALSFNNFTFNPEFSDELGFSFNSTYAQSLSPNNAALLEADYGPDQYRLAATWGHNLTLQQRIKLTIERLAQRIGYNFDSGTVNHWNEQNAFGGDYQFLLSQGHLNAFDISGYYAKANSDQLSPVTFANNTLINYRDIAGATSKGVGAGLNFGLWKNALLNTTINYDDVIYHTIYQNAPNASGLGETIAFEQLLNPEVKLKLLQSHRQIYDQYEAGLSWLLPVRPTTQLQLGFDLAHFNSHTALGNENRAGIKLSYSWDLPQNTNNTYSSLNNTQPNLTSWTTQPAVHMEQVLTTVDQKTTSISQPAFLATTAPMVLKQAADAPKIKKQIPDFSQSITNPTINIPLDKDKYFTNPLSMRRAMTLSVTGLPANLQATPANDVNLISGTADQSNVTHGPYTITVTAYNGITTGPHDPNYETSQTFTLTITGVVQPPVYNGPAQLPSGIVSSVYPPYDLQAQFTPATTQVTVDSTSLPPGLTFNNGKISGTPTTAGNFVLAVTATNNGVTIKPAISMQINPANGPHYNGNGITAGEYNKAYAYNLSQDFTPANTTITSVTGLPANLVLQANNIIAGTPQNAGIFPITVTAQANGIIIQQPMSLTITPHYNGNGMPAGMINQNYSFDLHQDFDPSTATISVAGNLPAGLQNNNGVISGTPTTTGTFPLSVTATVNGASTTPQIINLTIQTQAPHYNGPTNLPVGNAYKTYSGFNLTSNFSPAGAVVTVSNLPAGLTFDSSSGIISGTPIKAGNYKLDVSATYNNTTIKPTINIAIATTQGNLACPDSMANPAKMQSNDGVETYNFTGAASIAGQTWFKSELQGNTLSCHYYLGNLHVTTTISTQITDATVSGSQSCNSSRTSCAVITTYGG